MRTKLQINEFRVWDMKPTDNWFFLSKGDYDTININIAELDDLIELLNNVKKEFA